MFGDRDELRKYFRSVAQRRRARLETLGLCNRCGERAPKDGRKACTVCIALETAGNKRRRAAAKDDDVAD